jgi:hypothetical protein
VGKLAPRGVRAQYLRHWVLTFIVIAISFRVVVVVVVVVVVDAERQLSGIYKFSKNAGAMSEFLLPEE